MVLLAINTTIVTTGIVVFLIVIDSGGYPFVCKAKLTAKGDVKISINNGDRVITIEPGSSLLSTLAARKYSCPRPVVVKVPVVCVNAR